jgi:ferredoxin
MRAMPEGWVGEIEFGRLRVGDPVLFASEACLIVRRPGMTCGVCRDACPAGVLAGTEWSIAIDNGGCIGCGVCAAACPTGALVVEGCTPDPPESNPQPIALECRRVAAKHREPDAIVVPCLGGINTPDLLDLVAKSNSAIILKDHGWCAECPVGGCEEPWRSSETAPPSSNSILSTALIVANANAFARAKR